MNQKALSLPNFYQDCIKGHISLTQKKAFYTLFFGVNYENEQDFVATQESSISQILNGKKALPKFLRNSIQNVELNDLNDRIEALGIQDTKKTADLAAMLVNKSSLSTDTKKNLLNVYQEQKPATFLGIVFREAVKWCDDSEPSISGRQDLDLAGIGLAVKELGLSSNIETIEKDSLEERLRKYKEKFDIYKELGIIDCTKGLKETKLAPLQCMPNVKRGLDFSGVGGEKWVKDEQLRKAFTTMLARTKAAGGQVRFLLIDPDSDAYVTLYSLRGESVPYESYARFIEMVKKHKNLEVRLYDHMPMFRMQFVDEKYLAVSRYYFDKQQHDKWEGGWMIPHLIIHNEIQKDFGSDEVLYKWSLYDSFKYAYDFIWEKSRNILEWDKQGRKFRKNEGG
jgi:hypothetical protein